MKSFRLATPGYLAFIVLSAFCSVSSSLAIEIDRFDESGPNIFVIATDAFPLAQDAAAGLSVIGGTRKRIVTVDPTPGASNTSSILSGRLNHSQDVGSTGTTVIIWDADNIASNLKANGLGGIDFTQDDATAFRLEVAGFDFPDSKPILIRVELFDAADPSGSSKRDIEITIDEPINSPTTIDLPFSGFSGSGVITNVGAVRLSIIGDNPAADLALNWVGTNGNCPLVPDSNGTVFDICGQCPADTDYVAPDGPLKSCLDCNAEPFGNYLPGVQCETGVPGICSQGVLNEQCECPSPPPAVESCDGVDNDCDGAIDESFELLGEVCGATQEDCEVEGVFVCSDDGEITCQTDVQLEDLDGCGIEIGCDGVPGSDVTPDRCGVCGGDGESCDEACESTEIPELLFALDGNAKDQEQLVKQVSRRLKRVSAKPKDRKLVANSLEQAFDLQIRNWTLSWQLPSVSVSCPVSVENCVAVSNLSIIDEYVVNSVSMRQLVSRLTRRLIRNGFSPSRVRRFRRQAKRLHRSSLELTAEVPETQSRCF